MIDREVLIQIGASMGLRSIWKGMSTTTIITRIDVMRMSIR